MMNKIDVEQYKKWPQFEGFLNQLILKYESESSRPKMQMDENGVVLFEIPSEADLSIRGFSIASTAESSANTVGQAVNTARINHTRRKSRMRAALHDVADDVRSDLADNGDPVSETLGTGRSTFEIDIDDFARGDGSGFGQGVPVIEDIVEWFADCYQCDGRILGTLSTDLTLPEILIELGDFLGDIEDVLNTAIDSFDSSRALAQMCSMIPLGRWCIPDLTAFLGVLASLLQQYWLVDPTLEFSWWGIIAALLYPILQAAYSVLGMGLNLSVQPINCLTQILRDIRSLILATERLDISMGLSLGHLNATLQTTASNDRRYSREILERLSGKTDWFSGDSLLEYSEVLNVLSPIEISLLSVRDFQTRLSDLANWFSSRLNALRRQSREAVFASLKFTNVMLALGRLYSFIDALLKLVVHGKEICHEQFDDDGNLIFVLAKPIDEIYLEAGVVPPWITFEYDDSNDEDTPSGTKGPKNIPQVDQDTTLLDRRSLTIIDNSLGTRQVNIGCLGQVSEKDEEQVRKWIAELDSLSI